MNRPAVQKKSSESNRPPAPRSNQTPSLPAAAKYTISLLILLAGVATIFGLYQLRESTSRRQSDVLVPLVDTAAVEPFKGDLDLLVSGTVVAFRDIKISSQVSGRILKKMPECEAGNFIRAGTTLIEIDPIDYELEIKMVNAEILQAEKTLEETDEEIRGAKKNLELARKDFGLQKNEFDRFDRLRSSVSATELDRARRNLLNSESQLTTRQNSYDMLLARKERLKASLEVSRNRLEKAKLNLERTVLKAPVDGVIVRESVEQGNFVTVGSELLIFEDTSRSEILCNLTPGELSWLRYHAPESSLADHEQFGPQLYRLPRVAVQVFEQSEPDAIWAGVLERFDGSGRNATTKSIPVRIAVDQPVLETGPSRKVLVRGMYVKNRIVLPVSDANLAAFPLIAVRPGDYVWIVRDGKLKKVDIEVVDRTPISRNDQEQIVVNLRDSQLQHGDLVVTSPIPQPVDGAEVLLRDSETSPETKSAIADAAEESEDSETLAPASRVGENVKLPGETEAGLDRSKP